MWTEILTDPAIHELSNAEFRVWVNLLAIAAVEETKGIIPAKYDDGAISRLSGVDVRTCGPAVAGLTLKGRIDVTYLPQEGDNNVTNMRTIKIRNYQKYQSDTHKRYERKERKKSALEQNRTEQNRTGIYVEILTAWQTIKPRATLTEGAKGAINARLDSGRTVGEICDAIKNYHNSTDPFWAAFKAKGGWNLQQFLSRGEGEAALGKFVDGPINEAEKDDGYL